MNVLILGCGPAGLFAAHAAVREGHDVRILSKKRQSFMKGAQYLHRPIPELSANPFRVDYTLDGTVEGYRQKVYGDTADLLVSPQTLLGSAEAWDIRYAYDGAWERYSDLVVEWDVLDGIPDSLQIWADVTISTVPARLLCSDPSHTFRSTMVWATDMVKTREHFMAPDGINWLDNLVLCSGDPDDWWYRQSRIQGWENTEFPDDRKPRHYEGELWHVEKPIDTDCDCHPEILRMGRYGAWKKGVLSDAAFFDTRDALKTIAMFKLVP